MAEAAHNVYELEKNLYLALSKDKLELSDESVTEGTMARKARGEENPSIQTWCVASEILDPARAEESYAADCLYNGNLTLREGMLTRTRRLGGLAARATFVELDHSSRSARAWRTTASLDDLNPEEAQTALQRSATNHFAQLGTPFYKGWPTNENFILSSLMKTVPVRPGSGANIVQTVLGLDTTSEPHGIRLQWEIASENGGKGVLDLPEYAAMRRVTSDKVLEAEIGGPFSVDLASVQPSPIEYTARPDDTITIENGGICVTESGSTKFPRKQYLEFTLPTQQAISIISSAKRLNWKNRTKQALVDMRRDPHVCPLQNQQTWSQLKLMAAAALRENGTQETLAEDPEDSLAVVQAAGLSPFGSRLNELFMRRT